MNGDVLTVRDLLERNANPNVRGVLNDTAYDAALREDFRDNDPETIKKCRLMNWSCEPSESAIVIIGLLLHHANQNTEGDKITPARNASVYEDAVIKWELNNFRSELSNCQF